ncbi:MAG: GNAT family N-acetyltransferase [Candidatus Saccharimonadales bacterium]
MRHLPFEIIELDFSDRNLHVDAATRLFEEEDLSRWEEICMELNNEQRLERIRLLLGNLSNYGVMGSTGSLVAAASVDHRRKTDPSRDGPYSDIFFFAVYPQERRQGYGSALMHHIAERAFELGDDVVYSRAQADVHGVEGISFLWHHGFNTVRHGQFLVQTETLLGRSKK